MNQQTPLSLVVNSSDPPLYRFSTIPPACIPTSIDNALERHLRQVDRHVSLDLGGPADQTTDDQEVTSDPSTTPKPSKPSVEAGSSASGTPPSKRPRLQTPSPEENRHASAEQINSSGQRKPGSRHARRFWQILNPDHVFTFRYDQEVVPRLVRGLRTVVDGLTPSSLDESLALHQLVQFLFLLENRHSDFLPEALARFEEGDPSFGFATYEQRDKKGGSDLVRLVGYGGREEESTALAFSGECQAANIYARHLFPLAADHLSTASQQESRHYQYAPPVVSSVLDLAARPDPDADAEGDKIQVTTSTKLGIQRKFRITLRDLFVLFYVLLHSQIKVKVNPLDGKPSVEVSEEQQELLSDALIAILAQLAQEFHMNRCEYINLGVHDFSVTFQLRDRNTAHVSRIVFRDPATAERDILSKDELTNILTGIQDEMKRNAAVRTLLESKPWETVAQHSLFAVLVAGLLLPVGEGTTSMWMDMENEFVSQVQETSATGLTSDTSQPGFTATGGTSAFKMIPYSAVAAKLQSYQSVDTTHHLLMKRLSCFRWEEDPTFRVQVSPPLTTDESVVSTTGDEKSIRQEPEDLNELLRKPDHQTVLSLLSCPDLSVELLQHLGSGRLWDAYYVKLSSGSTPSQIVVAKICNLYTFTLGDAYEYETPSAAAEAITTELDALNALQAVQGEIIPRLYGRWTGWCQLPNGGKARLECVMLEDCGTSFDQSDELEYHLWYDEEVERSLIERLPAGLSSNVQQQIIESYERLHKQGILHVDVNAQHILFHPVDNKPRIIDFDSAISISEAQATNQDYDAEAEMERIRWMVHADEEH
ncbi:hypothetical protein L198_07818 [Cryptococcus wingfieldii CBS 7118]|uniref:Protein kinase domain-containing protein n=1 Tax=Cryptococcus wingfieldii CBS 7118 TaxID=1295528 RepID=A0A1E3HVG5_9TREE|nr:hypothetical protein L198_07818 [Cryptococcus wingfieldii CBS 7118]ODN80318.1 hypothetical protein L198_07818 [Cryptococcus wingfieldii CBS 7118]